MRVKTNDLIGAALDWAVAKALGYDPKVKTWSDIIATLDPEEDADLIAFHTKQKTVRVRYSNPVPGTPCPKFSTNWAQGGPIVGSNWTAIVSILQARFGRDWAYTMHVDGCTTLAAFMRGYVASEIGDEVDLPEELL